MWYKVLGNGRKCLYGAKKWQFGYNNGVWLLCDFFSGYFGVGLFFLGGVLFFFLTNLKMFVHLRHEKDVFTPVD